MAKGVNIATIEKNTGKTWDEWLEFLEGIDAKNLTHKEIAQRIHDAGTPGWWTQAVTVAYEQHIGRRAPGQDNDGTFTITASKTLDGTMDEALATW